MASRFFCTINKTSLKRPSDECYEKTMNAETKARLIERVKSLEGLTNDERSALLELLRTEKAYGLVWENKPEDVEERLRDELPVLVEDETKRFISDSADAPNHVLIEGDNLEALTALAYTHAGKIDVIYIDPPYNTGNKDFIYNDAFVDSEDSYRHSKWLSFMSKRLRIAKKLLSDRGVIFISIDDNEQANLKLLCDDVFGNKNFISNLIWQKKFSRSNDALYFSTMHDHILCYCKRNIKESQEGWQIGLLKREGEIPKGYSNPDNDYRGVWTSTIMSAKSGAESLLYEITTPSGRVVTPPNGRYWSCSKDTFEKWRAENRIWFGKDGNGSPRKKTFLSEVQAGLRPNSLILQEEGGNNQEGKQELKAIMNGEGVFDGPKPTRLIEHLLKIANCDNSTILDFFAGSGTTLHAVMQLNAEDGGQRQCILVTNNENGICENVTYERNKRVINGYTKPNGDHVEGLHANSLRYYRTTYVGRNRTPQNLRRLVELSTDMLCIKEDLYTECHEFAGVKTRKQFFRYYEQDSKRMLIIYREEYVPDLVNLINRLDLPDGERIQVYVFSPSEDPWAGEFEPVEDKITLCALPMAILNAYRRVLPKRREQVIYVDQETSKKPEVPATEPTLFDMNEEGGAQ